MGMYTLFHCSVVLKPDTPQNVIETIKHISEHNEWDAKHDHDHEFFKCERKSSIMRCSSAYFDEPNFLILGHEYDYDETNYFTLRVQSSLKNYDDEITKFADWLRPYLHSGLIYSRYEESVDNKILFTRDHYK